MSKRPLRHFPNPFGPPWWFQPLLFLATFELYAVTLDPSLFRNDSPETITACFTLGVSHPPGYPLHTLLGRLFALNPIGNPAMTLNFFSAFLGALGVCLFALNLWILLRKSFPGSNTAKAVDPFSLTAVCMIGGLCFAVSKSYWSISLAAKGGIYSFQVVLELGLLLYFQLWVQSLNKAVGDAAIRSAYFLVFLFTLGLANHWPTHLLLTLAFVIAGLAYRQSGLFRFFQNLHWKHILTALTLSVLVLSLYLYLPLRAHLNPGLNFGNPSTFHGFVSSLTRAKYFKKETISSFLPTALSTIQDKGLYISDRFGKEFNILFSFIAFPGLLLLWRRKLKAELLFLLSLLLTTLLANLLYLQVLPIEYWHMDDHLMTLNWVTALLASVGFYFLFNHFKPRGFSKYALCGFLALLPVFTFFKNLTADNQKNQFLFWGYGMEALKSMDQNADYFAESDYDYFSILYLREVEHKREDLGLTLTAFMDEKDWQALLEWEATQPHNLRPKYCAFPNGDFINGYLKHAPTTAFKPQGTIIQFMPPKEGLQKWPNQSPLEDLGQRFLNPEIKCSNPINGLLLQLCAHPYLNMANYLKFHNDMKNWSSYYLRALSLIQNQEWRTEASENMIKGYLESGKLEFSFVKNLYHQSDVIEFNIKNTYLSKVFYEVGVEKKINNEWQDAVPNILIKHWPTGPGDSGEPPSKVSGIEQNATQSLIWPSTETPKYYRPSIGLFRFYIVYWFDPSTTQAAEIYGRSKVYSREFLIK